MHGPWSPAAAGLASRHLLGLISNSNGRGKTSLPPASGCTDGDYWMVFLVGGGKMSLPIGTVYPGDAVVCRANQWAIQPSPASGLPVGTVQPGDTWQVAANGVFDGRAYKAGEQAVHYGGAYYHFFLPSAFRPSLPAIGPGVYWIGDSMSAYARPAAIAAIPRVVVDALNSAGSAEIASVFQYRTLTGAVTQRDVVVWAGQNTEDKWWETNAALDRIRAITQSQGQRMIVVIPVGRREFTFNGQRLVGKWQEALQGGTDLRNGLVETQALIRKDFPVANVDARAAVLAAVQAHAAAFSNPDPQFPGMTELQTAKRFGLVPLSVYQNLAQRGFPANAAFAGYWSDPNLPPQIAPGQYYIRSAGKSIGDLIANINGQVTELGIAGRNSIVHFAGPNAGIANAAVVAAVRRLTG